MDRIRPCSTVDPPNAPPSIGSSNASRPVSRSPSPGPASQWRIWCHTAGHRGGSAPSRDGSPTTTRPSTLRTRRSQRRSRTHQPTPARQPPARPRQHLVRIRRDDLGPTAAANTRHARRPNRPGAPDRRCRLRRPPDPPSPHPRVRPDHAPPHGTSFSTPNAELHIPDDEPRPSGHRHQLPHRGST